MLGRLVGEIDVRIVVAHVQQHVVKAEVVEYRTLEDGHIERIVDHRKQTPWKEEIFKAISETLFLSALNVDVWTAGHLTSGQQEACSDQSALTQHVTSTEMQQFTG